jgi:hypothetical protein
MFGMKALQVLLSLVALSATMWGSAPESIGGKVYHDHVAFQGLSYGAEIIVVLGTDGRYSFLKDVSGSILSGPFINLQSLPRDGNYSYTRTGETTATLLLQEPGGTLDSRSTTNGKADSLTLALTFADSVSGSVFVPPSDILPMATTRGNFYLTDATSTQLKPVANVSMRGNVAFGHPLIAGFIVPGDSQHSVDVLVRVVGPSLAQFGITGAWADPDFQLYYHSVILAAQFFWTDAHVANWSQSAAATATFSKLFGYLGAFPLLAGSKDAASIMRLPAGDYTVVASATTNDPGGEALVEIYFLP